MYVHKHNIIINNKIDNSRQPGRGTEIAKNKNYLKINKELNFEE